MQWSPISTSSWAATITPMFKKQPEPIRMRPWSPVVIQTFGSNNVPSPTSSVPLRNDSRTLPCTGQRTKAFRFANSAWIASRFHGSELRSYHRHFCHQSVLSGNRLLQHLGQELTCVRALCSRDLLRGSLRYELAA